MKPTIPREVLEWDWNPKVMADDKLKRENSNSPIATAEMLYNVLWTLVPLHDNLTDGMMSWFSALCLTKDMWDATNFARLWPEYNHQLIDGMLQDAMSHIAEVHYMLESMWAWDKFTEQAIRSVTVELEYSISALQKALMEVEYYIYTLTGEQNGDDESRQQ